MAGLPDLSKKQRSDTMWFERANTIKGNTGNGTETPSLRPQWIGRSAEYALSGENRSIGMHLNANRFASAARGESRIIGGRTDS